MNNPTGTLWRRIPAPLLDHISAGASRIFGIDPNDSILRFSGEIISLKRMDSKN